MSAVDPTTAAAAVATGAQDMKGAWLRAAVLLALLALPFVLFWPAAEALLSFWLDTDARTYTHGLPILGLSVWMILRNRAQYAAAPVSVSWPAAFALPVLGVIWLVAYRAGIQIVFVSLLPLIALAAVMACFGWQVVRRMWLAVAYLYFAVPAWDLINPLLQWSAVFAVRFVLRLAGIPVHFVENTVHIPAGTFEIADACSGLHYFIVALAIAALYGELHRDSFKTRALLVVLGGALAVLSNWVRIVVIIIAGYTTDMQHSLVSEEHYTFGWYVFAGAMVLFFLIARRLPLDAARQGTATAEPGGEPRAVPLKGVCVAVLALALVPAWNLIGPTLAADYELDSVLPERVASWSGPQESPSDWAPVFVGADLERQALYRRAGGEVEVYSAIYFEQRQGKELIGYGNSLLGQGWTAGDTRAAPIAPWTEVEASDRHGARWLLWHAYRIEDRWHAGGLNFQLTYGLTSLAGAPVSSVLIVRAACRGDCESVRPALQDFVTAAWAR